LLAGRNRTSVGAILLLGGTGDGFYVATNATPVPEPGTWLMMIAGLGVLFALYRRRQSA